MLSWLKLTVKIKKSLVPSNLGLSDKYQATTSLARFGSDKSYIEPSTEKLYFINSFILLLLLYPRFE